MIARVTVTNVRNVLRHSENTKWAQKSRLFMRVDNFAMVNGRKIRIITKVSEFCIEKKV